MGGKPSQLVSRNTRNKTISGRKTITISFYKHQKQNHKKNHHTQFQANKRQQQNPDWCKETHQAQATLDASTQIPLMLLARSVDTPIQDSRFHLPPLHSSSAPRLRTVLSCRTSFHRWPFGGSGILESLKPGRARYALQLQQSVFACSDMKCEHSHWTQCDFWLTRQHCCLHCSCHPFDSREHYSLISSKCISEKTQTRGDSKRIKGSTDEREREIERDRDREMKRARKRERGEKERERQR